MSIEPSKTPNINLKSLLRRYTSALLFLACLLCSSGLQYFPPVQLLSLKILDQSFNWQRRWQPVPIADAVVLIGIDEQTYETFAEPFALWHAHLGELFQALALAQPNAVGLDFSFPDRSFNTIIPDSDQKLLSGLATLKQVAPVVLGITIEQSGLARKVYPPYLSVAGEDGHAYVLWQLEADRVVRQFKPVKDRDGNVLPTLVGNLAKHLHKPMQAGYINFALGAQLNYIPLQQVLQLYQQQDIAKLKQMFAHKSVLVGTVLPFEDRHYQPVNLARWEQDNANFVPGVLIHAQALRSVLHHGFIQPIPKLIEWLLILVVCACWWLKLSLGRSALLLFGLWGAGYVAHWYLLNCGWFLPPAAIALSAFGVLSGRLGYTALLLLLERRRLKGVFSGYVGPNVMQEIIQGRIQPGVHGQRKHICVLFSDIRSFTSISEALEPEQVISFLNLYLDAMVTAIQQHEGTIDKFMGDGIMAFFGAPNALAHPCQQAFAAAKAKLAALEKLNQEFAATSDFPQLKIGIGLHVGDAVVGNIGSTQRNEFTAIGDVVNTGSRLEGLTKQLGYPLVVSAEVIAQLNCPEEFDALGEVPIKGRAPMSVYGWPKK